MRIVEDTKNKLILREENYIFSIILFLLFCLFKIVLINMLFLTWKREILNCQRIQVNRVDCTIDENIGPYKVTTKTILPFVQRAEYKKEVIKSPPDDEEICFPIRKHELILWVYGGNNRFTFIETKNCSFEENWIQDKVAKINSFIAASDLNLKSIELEKKKGEEEYIIIILGSISSVIGFSVMGLFFLFVSLNISWRISYHFDNLKREFVYYKTTMLNIKKLSYPLRDISLIRVIQRKDSEGDDEEKGEIVFKSGEKIQLGENLVNRIIDKAQKVADFVGVKLEIIDERKPS